MTGSGSKKRNSMMVAIALLASLLVLMSAPTQVQGQQSQQAQPDQSNRSQPEAAVGSGITYQGQLKDGGNPANGQYDFQFRLYDTSSGGTQVGSTLTTLNQTVSTGLFTIQLDFGATAYQGQGRWLEIGVRVAGGPSYTTLSPRQALNATPYAASLMPGVVITSTGSLAVLTGSSTSTADGLRGSSLGGFGVYGSSNIGDGVYGTSTSGNGVSGNSLSLSGLKGTTSGGSNVAGVLGMSTSSNGDGVGVRGIADSGASARGVWGSSTGGDGVYGMSSIGRGVRGDSGSSNGVYGTSGSAYGVLGVSMSNWGIKGNGTSGVWGEAGASNGTGVSGTSSAGIGVQGTSASSNGVSGTTGGGGTVAGVRGTATGANGTGVWGTANNGTSAYGVWGDSTNGYGVYGQSTSNWGIKGRGTSGVWGEAIASNGTGVSGSATGGIGVHGSATTGWAGWFDGDVNVTGSCCAAGMGTFKIDHPADPEGKYLVQAAVQSPDTKNIYDGVATLDARGETTVNLPTYVEALNTEFRYQLTCLGGFAPVYIVQEITGSSFKIAGGKAGMKVSWQVTGLRKDPYALAHPIQVEVEKPADEQGRYRHPTEWGQPESMGIGYEEQQHLLVSPSPPQASKP